MEHLDDVDDRSGLERTFMQHSFLSLSYVKGFASFVIDLMVTCSVTNMKDLYRGQNFIIAKHKPCEHRLLMTQKQHQLRSSTKSDPNIVTGSTSVVGFSRKGIIIVVLKSWQQTSACPSGESWCWQRVDASSFYWSDSLTNPYQSWHLTNCCEKDSDGHTGLPWQLLTFCGESVIGANSFYNLEVRGHTNIN